jgi:hypothetical protein
MCSVRSGPDSKQQWAHFWVHFWVILTVGRRRLGQTSRLSQVSQLREPGPSGIKHLRSRQMSHGENIIAPFGDPPCAVEHGTPAMRPTQK